MNNPKKNQYIFFLILSFHIFVLHGVLVAQGVLGDSTQTTLSAADSSGVTPASFHEKLIHNSFSGVADLFLTQTRLHVNDLAEKGRPKLFAESNFQPHQALITVDGVIANSYTHGMFNSRFLSASAIDGIDLNSATPAGVNILRRAYFSEEEAYTRLMFYEGDAKYTDLDIYFSHQFTPQTKVILSGFNRGFGGSGNGFNNGHVGVGYWGLLSHQFNPNTVLELQYQRNHERSGLQNFGTFSNQTYAADRTRYDLRLITFSDSTKNEKVTVGLRTVNDIFNSKSQIDSFTTRMISDNHTLYIKKEVGLKKGLFSFEFDVENHVVHGPAFENAFSESLFGVKLNYVHHFSSTSQLRTLIQLQHITENDPLFRLFAQWQKQSDFGQTALTFLSRKRLPTPVARKFSYKGYSGNENLKSETINQAKWMYGFPLPEAVFFNAEAGYNQILDEVVQSNNSFKNGKARSWSYLQAETGWKNNIFNLNAGAQIIPNDIRLTPKQKAWTHLSYSDLWFKRFKVDLSARLNWFGQGYRLQYNPIIHRFTPSDKKYDAYTLLAFKGVITISDAEVFFEMDNPFNNEMHMVEGYIDNFRNVRFGVNWVLWD